MSQTNQTKQPLQYENVFVVKDIIKKGDREVKTKKVLARLFDPNTQESVIQDVTDLSIPDIFIADDKSKGSKFRSYIDKRVPLTRHSFPNLFEYNKFIKGIKEKTGEIVTMEYEGEIITFDETVFDDRAFGYQNLAHSYIHRNFKDSVASDHDHRIWFIDIETRSDYMVDHFPHAYMSPEPITVIQIYDSFTKKYTVIGLKDFTDKFDDELTVQYVKVKDEKAILELFLRLLRKQNPSIISGFNSMQFDIPTITNRIAKVLDGFDGDEKSELNQKNSYEDMPNVLRLSPVGVVEGVSKSITKDGMDGVSTNWFGHILIDYRELALKYGFLGLASYSLKNIAKKFNLSQKLDTSMYKNFDGTYTGMNYVFPEVEPERGKDPIFDMQKDYRDGKVPYEDLEQIAFNRFIDYSLRDVEILVQLNDMTGWLNSHKAIAYESSVSMDDNWGTLKFWHSLIYRESLRQGLVLPLKQQHADKYAIFLAGWVRTMPGKYDFVTSFDFTSLYPNLIRAFNIGGDTLLKEYQLPQELKDLRAKYFQFFVPSVLNREEYPDRKVEEGKEILGDHHPLGSLVKLHKGDINDTQEEVNYYSRLMANVDEISAVLSKHNVSATPNGYFYSNEYQSILAQQMEHIFEQRLAEKREGQRLGGVLNDINAELTSRGIK